MSANRARKDERTLIAWTGSEFKEQGNSKHRITEHLASAFTLIDGNGQLEMKTAINAMDVAEVYSPPRVANEMG